MLENKKNPFQRALGFANLSQGWDTYGASKINQEAINAACEFLVEHVPENLREKAHVFPAKDGGVQIEWRAFRTTLSMCWSPEGNMMSLLRIDKDGNLPKLAYDKGAEATLIASSAISAIQDLAERSA